MLIPLAAQIGDSLAPKERKVALNPGLDRALTKSPKCLPMLLTVEDGGFE